MIFISFATQAQKPKKVRLFHEFYDEKPLHLGFLIGFVSTNLNISTRSVLASENYLYSPRNMGLQIGGVANYSLSKHWGVKTGMSVVVLSRQLSFTEKKDDLPEEILTRNSTGLEIPLSIKYRSVRRDNHRVYMTGGIKFSLEVNNKVRSAPLTTKTADLAIEYGFGLERFFHFYKFTPEIRFSHGLINVFSPPSATSWYSGVSNLKSHSVSLVFNFE